VSIPFFCEILGLKPVARDLIQRACYPATRVELSPLDKGLSGSSVWLAQWNIAAVDTKHHVFKIGDIDKIRKEAKAIDEIASVLDTNFGHTVCILDEHNKMGLLRQAFIGSADKPSSLRTFIQECANIDEVGDKLNNLYYNKMSRWHPRDKLYVEKEMFFEDALDWWMKKEKLDENIRLVGRRALEKSIVSKLQITVDDITKAFRELVRQKEKICLGPIHGDLHSQNVLVSPGSADLYLIDFGWTDLQKWRAIDFLMMECSLRFFVAPPHATVDDMLCVDKILDEPIADLGCFEDCLYGNELKKIVRGVTEIRKAAVELRAVLNFKQYRKGLIILTACLAGYPAFNLAYLFHSLGYQIKKCKDE
jgi:hypothetical protein